MNTAAAEMISAGLQRLLFLPDPPLPHKAETADSFSVVRSVFLTKRRIIAKNGRK